MTALDLAGIITRVCTDLKDKFADKGVETSKQDTLVSGTNIKTVNNVSLLGSGNISTPNSIAYQLRCSTATLPAASTSGPYRLWFTSADGKKHVPINTSTSTSPTTAKTLNTQPIDPFGRIVYAKNSQTANFKIGATDSWEQYWLSDIRYSYVKTLTDYNPVYLKCTPQADGSAIMADVVQALPTSNDGYIYVFLGVATGTYAIELLMHHPVYYHDGTGIRLWTGATTSGGGSAASVLTLYVDSSSSNLWVDQARTETLCSHYDYDLSAIKTAFAGFDVIRVFWPDMSKMATVLLWKVDTVDEDFYVDVAVNAVSGKLASNATEYTFEAVRRIYPS